MRPRSDRDETAEKHPSSQELGSFMTGALPRSRAAAVVRHLLRGCPACQAVTGALWGFGDEPLRPFARRPPARQARPAGAWQ